MILKSHPWIVLLAGAVVLTGSLALSLAGETKSHKKELEKKITLQQLPPSVRATIEKEAGQHKIKELEKVTRGEKQHYEAEWVDGEKTVEIKVAPNGKLLRKEIEEEDEDDAKKPSGESERKVTEAEVPAAALATLKKMAAGATITEYAKEIEHGSTFYEGSWKSTTGTNVDVLVTAAGALVEIEEKTAADQVPQAVLAAAQKTAGKDAKLGLEKKTMVLYEIHFRKGNRHVELLLTPDGRRVREPGKHDEQHEHGEH